MTRKQRQKPAFPEPGQNGHLEPLAIPPAVVGLFPEPQSPPRSAARGVRGRRRHRQFLAGNLHSAAKAFERAAREQAASRMRWWRNCNMVRKADRVVLPGIDLAHRVRTGTEAVRRRREALEETVRGKGRPFLGICVGMQLMADAAADLVAGWARLGGAGGGRQDRAARSGAEDPHRAWAGHRSSPRKWRKLLDGLHRFEPPAWPAYCVHSYALGRPIRVTLAEADSATPSRRWFRATAWPAPNSTRKRARNLGLP